MYDVGNHINNYLLIYIIFQIFASSAKTSLKVDEQVVNFIFQAIVDSHGDHYTQAQLLISLQALAKVCFEQNYM